MGVSKADRVYERRVGLKIGDDDVIEAAAYQAPDEACSHRWFVAQTHPRKEKQALQNLTNQGFTTFCPRQRKFTKIGRRQVERLDPFFPGYVFVSLDLERQGWHSINGTYCVTKLIGFGGGANAQPAPAPVGLVEDFQALSDEFGELKFAEPLARGDRVRVVGGAFANLYGTLEQADHPERVTVLMHILSQETRVSLKRNELMLA